MKKLIFFLFLFIASYSYSQVKVDSSGNIIATGLYPVANNNDLKAGIHDVQTIIGRDAIPANFRRLGMLAYVVDSLKYYQLKTGVTNSDWVEFISGTASIAVSDTFYVQLPLYVDSSSGRKVLKILHDDGVISGGIVSWSGVGLTFDIPQTIYYINGVLYTAPPTSITLDAADATYSRVDLFAVDTTGNIIKVTGEAGATPIIPQTDHGSQLPLTTGIMLNAGDTIPSNINVELVYDENIEWASSKSASVTADFNSVGNAYNGVKSTYVSLYNKGNVAWVRSSAMSSTSDMLIKFHFYSNGAFLNKLRIDVRNVFTTVGSTYLNISNLNPNDSNRYQTVTVPFSQLHISSGTQFDRLVFNNVGVDTSGAKGYFIDYIQLQSGIPNIPPPGTCDTCISTIVKSIDSAYFKRVNGDTAAALALSSPTPTLQQSFDASVVAGDYPTINAHGGVVVIDSTSAFGVLSHDDNTTSSLGVTPTRLGATVQTLSLDSSTSFNVDIDSATVVSNRVTELRGDTHWFIVKPDYIKIKSGGDEQSTKLIIENTDTLLTPPTYIWGADGDTLKKVAYPTGGGDGSGITLTQLDSAVSPKLSISDAFTYIDTSLFVNVRTFGAIGDSSTISDHAINDAINYAASNNINRVVIPDGWYLIDSAIRLKSNIHLEVANTATIELIPGSNSYILTNDDLTNGNDNIEVSGGVWIGNAGTQTLKYSSTSLIDTSYYGFGFHFYKVNDLYVHNLKIEKSQTWGIAHFGGNGFNFSHIKFKQDLRNSYNGDGITGSSSNGIIDDISGYTNDDMICVSTVFASLANQGGGAGNYPASDVSNVIIKNIRAELYDSANINTDTAYALRQVRVFSGGGHSVSNITISGITGTSKVNPVIIDSYDTSGIFSNISIDNINSTTRNKFNAFIYINNVKRFDNISIANINRIENITTDYPFLEVRNSIGNNVNVTNVNNVQNNGLRGSFIYDLNSSVKSFNVNNVYHSDSSFTAPQVFYRKSNAGTLVTNINAQNIKVVDTTGILKRESSAKFSINSTSFISDTTLLTPSIGNVINSRQVGITYYTTKWNYNSSVTLSNLTASTGLTGSTYDGTAAVSWTNDLVTGKSGGQTVTGGTASGNNLTLRSTSHATKGKILFGTSAYDEVNNRLGIGTASPTFPIDVFMAGTAVTIDGNSNYEDLMGFRNAGGHGGTIGGNTTDGITYFRSNTTNDDIAFITRYNPGAGNINTEAVRIKENGNVGIGVTAPSEKLEINGNIKVTQLKLSDVNTAPASATATGTKGEIRWTPTYVYFCTATNTWVRAALATW
jgi:hypothetical protein